MDVDPCSNWLVLMFLWQYCCHRLNTQSSICRGLFLWYLCNFPSDTIIISCLPIQHFDKVIENDRSLPVFSTCMLCYAYMSFLFQWLSWRHSSDGSWVLDYGSMSSRHSPSLEQGPRNSFIQTLECLLDMLRRKEWQSQQFANKLKHSVFLVICNL